MQDLYVFIEWRGKVMITLIGKCMNCGNTYGIKVTGTLESIYELDDPIHIHKCEKERANNE